MGDAHEVVVDDVGKVVGRQTVALQEHLIVERLVFDRNVAKACIVEGRGALLRDALADDIGFARGDARPGLFKGKTAAGIVRAVKFAAVLLAFRLFAEAVVGVAALD